MRPRRSSFRTQPSFRPTYQDFQPKSEMNENQEACFLHIQLPGFKKERIRIQFEDSSRTMKISGEIPIDGRNKRSRFKQSYTVPQICDTNKIQSNFSQGILTITMPKKLISQDAASKAETPQDKAPTPSKKAQDFIPPKSAREEPGDNKSVASSSSSSVRGPDGLKGQKGQEEVLSQRPFDGQKPVKEFRANGEKGQEKILQKPKITMATTLEKQADSQPQKVQVETEPKPTLKMAAIKPMDEMGQEEIEVKPKIVTMAGATKRQTDNNKTQKDQDQTEPKPTLKVVPRMAMDEKAQKGQEESELKPRITMVGAPERQTDGKPQRVQEETEPEPTSKIAPRKTMDNNPQKGQEEIVQKPKITMAEVPGKQTDGKPQRVQEETEPKLTLKIAPRKTMDDNSLKGQEDIVQKPIRMAEGAVKQKDGKPQGVLEEIKQNTTLTTIPRKQANQKTAGKRDEDADKEMISKKETTEIERKSCDSRKPEKGVVKEKEIRARRELAKEDELSASRTLEKEKKTTSKAAAANEYNHNNGMIGTIEKGIKEVVASVSQALTRIAEGKWDDEDKPLLINMGVTTLVLAAVGMYAFYRFSPTERT